ncbi:MAG TPA: TusE/DsrC/DsvC family sulfur relay protein [Gammaproteobacteria bacterium]
MTTEHEIMPFTAALRRQSWSEAQAERIAREHGIESLTEEHWCVINTLRDHFIQYGALPPMRFACDINRLEPHCVDHLFHSPQEAWRIAGLPDPDDEAEGYAYPGDMVQY